jgi:hypothetical protein
MFIQTIILLKPDTRRMHQHGIRNKDLHNDTPTATATYHLAWPYDHNIGPPWLPTTDNFQHCEASGATQSQRTPTYNGWTMSVLDTCFYVPHTPIFVNEISSPPLTLMLLIILYCNIVPLTILYSNLMMA